MPITGHDVQGTLVIQDERVLYDRDWRFRLPVAREFWEDIFDPIDGKAASPKGAMRAYERDPVFWAWLVEPLVTSASVLASANATVRTINLEPIVDDDPLEVYRRFQRSIRK